MSNNISYCTFCLRECTTEKFSREHIIPSSIGGKIIIGNIICEDCNNYFGTKIDHKALKSIDVIELSKKFGVIDDSSRYISSAYDIKIKAEGHSLKGVMKKNEIKPLPQKISDDHLITPEEDILKTLLKIVERDSRLNHLNENERGKAVDKLLIEYSKLNFGEEVTCKIIGRTLKKGVSGDKIEYSAKESSDPLELLILKVVFEWLVIVAYQSFFNTPTLYNLLRNSLIKQELQKGVNLIRLEETQHSRPFHTVILQFEEYSTTAVVSLFSKITYQVFLPNMDLSFLSKYNEQYNTDSILGIQIEDHFQKNERMGSFIRANGDRISIPLR
ncbi:MAG TPA: hypothetical protein DCE78_09945 [Bacteroidetes bacterium]|nr:hypothetical protein [Bacteroidota bacterium]